MSIRKVLAISFLDRYASLLIGIVSSMILARLLTPADIGVFSITLVLLSFVTTFRDFGAGQYLVQERELTDDRIRAVWTVQLGIGAALALLAWVASVPVSRFYDEPRMREIMWVLGLSYLVNPFGSLTYAWLMRTMRYDALALMRFSAAVVGALVSLGLAWAGHGPISLAWGNLATIVTNAAMSTLFRPGHFPLLPGRGELRRVLSFGSRLTMSSIIETATTGLPELVLGKLQTMTQVGLFSRGNGLVAMFQRLVSDAVNTVALSMFAKAQRESGGFPDAFLRANAYVSVLGLSFAGLLVTQAQPLLRLLYGAQWDSAADITRWLALAMAAMAPAALCVQALMAAGAAQDMLGAMTRASAVTVVAGVAGASAGLEPLGVGLTLAACIAAVIWLRTAQRVIGFDWSAYRRMLLQSVGVSAGACAVPVAVVAWLGSTPSSSVLSLCIAVPGQALGFVVAALLIRHPITDELRTVWAKVAGRG